jgi:hypothetical protein
LPFNDRAFVPAPIGMKSIRHCSPLAVYLSDFPVPSVGSEKRISAQPLLESAFLAMPELQICTSGYNYQ